MRRDRRVPSDDRIALPAGRRPRPSVPPGSRRATTSRSTAASSTAATSSPAFLAALRAQRDDHEYASRATSSAPCRLRASWLRSAGPACRRARGRCHRLYGTPKRRRRPSSSTLPPLSGCGCRLAGTPRSARRDRLDVSERSARRLGGRGLRVARTAGDIVRLAGLKAAEHSRSARCTAPTGRCRLDIVFDDLPG